MDGGREEEGAGMGAKVFLNERNTFYHYLNRIGVYIFSIDKELINRGDSALEGLNDSQIKHNREILVKKISFEKLKSKMAKSLKSIALNVN